MRNILLAAMCIVVLSSCGTLHVSQEDKKLISEGKKSLLTTQNRDPSDYFFVIPILIDALGGQPTQVDIESIDGQEVGRWFKANQEVAVEPGIREVAATYTIRDEKDDSLYQSDVQTISYFFEGGKRYRLYVLEHFDWCEICIGRF
jgi:hypothetical protein